jgi:two-component system response regulator CpxR
MSFIAMFSASYCSEDEMARKLADRLGYADCTSEVIQAASRTGGVSGEKLVRAMQGPGFFFNNISHERERAVAFLRLALAEALCRDNLICQGYISLLAPRFIPHVLRVGVVADDKHRIVTAQQHGARDAAKLIRRDDQNAGRWIHYLFGADQPRDSLYDIVIPLHIVGIDAGVEIIRENSGKEALKTTDESRRLAEEHVVAARVGVALATRGYYFCDVFVHENTATIVINKETLRLGKLEQTLAKIAESVPGVKRVVTRVGPEYNQPNISFKMDITLPKKALLVDDEKEFVVTLSERLMLRDIPSVVVHDGEQALVQVSRDKPDVMVLDLKMPGIDGMQVLRQVKSSHPGIEVIILTGHGTEKDRIAAMELGAFAYLQKPVDVDVLARTMKEAYRKIGRQ